MTRSRSQDIGSSRRGDGARGPPRSAPGAIRTSRTGVAANRARAAAAGPAAGSRSDPPVETSRTRSPCRSSLPQPRRRGFVLPPLEVREHDAQVTAQEDESLLAEPKLDNPCLVRVQLQAQPLHDETNAPQCLLRVCLAATEHDGWDSRPCPRTYPHTRARPKPGPLAPAAFAAFTATMDPSDSLSTRRDFAVRLYPPPLPDVGCRGGSPQFRVRLSLRARFSTPGASCTPPDSRRSLLPSP